MKALRGFGRALMLLRTRRGWTQRDLARHTGIGRGLVSQYEGEQVSPKIQTLDRLLNALEASAGDLATALEQVQRHRATRRAAPPPRSTVSQAPLPEASAYLVVPLHGDDAPGDPTPEPDPDLDQLAGLVKSILQEVARRLWTPQHEPSTPDDAENGECHGG